MGIHSGPENPDDDAGSERMPGSIHSNQGDLSGRAAHRRELLVPKNTLSQDLPGSSTDLFRSGDQGRSRDLSPPRLSAEAKAKGLASGSHQTARVSSPTVFDSLSERRKAQMSAIMNKFRARLKIHEENAKAALRLATQASESVQELADDFANVQQTIFGIMEDDYNSAEEIQDNIFETPKRNNRGEVEEEQQEVEDILDPTPNAQRNRLGSSIRPRTNEEIIGRVRYLDAGGRGSFERQLRRSGDDNPGGSSDSSDDGDGGGGGNFKQFPTPRRKVKPLSSISRGQVIAGNTVITSQPTPSGVIQYENDALHRLKIWIRERVGSMISAPEIKGLKVQVPDAYGGADSIQESEEWLGNVLRYYRVLRICGPDLNHERVVHLGLMLKGKALDWFVREVESPTRVTPKWRFTELVCALYVRFITEATAAKAMDVFLAVRYAKSKGVLSFYNDLQTAAARMIQRPDDYTMRRRFMDGLPLEIVETMMRSRSVSAEHSSMDEILYQAKQVETTIESIDRYKKSRGGSQPTQTSKSGNPVQGNSGFNRQVSQPARYNNSLFKGNSQYTPRNTTAGSTGTKQASQPVSQNSQPKVGNSLQPSKAVTGTTTGNVCFACGKTGHFAKDPVCPMYGKPRPKARLNAAQVVDDRSDVESDQEVNNTDREEGRKPAINQSGDEHEDVTPYEGDQYSPEDYVGLEQYEAEYDSEDDVQLRSARVYAMTVVDEEEEEQRVSKPFRSAMQRPDQTGMRPPRDDNLHRCLAAMVEINGISAYALFDSGSSADVMSPDFARVSECRLFKLDRPVTLQLGCIGSRGMINHGTNAVTKLRGVESRHYFDIVNVDRYDVILGAPFMTTKKIILDFEKGQVLAGHTAIPTLSVTEEKEVIATRKGKHPSK